MNSDDDLVLSYLGKYPKAFISPMEVCKRAADRRRFAAEPNWAKPVLVRLAQQNVLECNVLGHYRIRCEEEEEEKKHKRPYEPRPEPAAQAQPVGSEQKVETTAKAETAVTRKEDQKSAPAPAPAGEKGAEAAGEGGEARTNPVQASGEKDGKTLGTPEGGCKEGKTPAPLPQVGGCSQPNKKAA